MNERKIWMIDDSKHRNRNCFVLTIISHGDSNNYIFDKNGERGWNIEDLIEEISDIPNLIGKPKLFFIQACRGGKFLNGLIILIAMINKATRLEIYVFLPPKSVNKIYRDIGIQKIMC